MKLRLISVLWLAVCGCGSNVKFLGESEAKNITTERKKEKAPSNTENASSDAKPDTSTVPKEIKKAAPTAAEKFRVFGVFDAFYYQDTTLIATAKVVAPSISYSWSSFLGIPSQSFRAIWRGKVGNESSTYTPVVKFKFPEGGWFEWTLYIDGKKTASYARLASHLPTKYPEDFDGENFRYEFGPGSHNIEIHLKNNYHVTDFSVEMIGEEG